jgi:hypothetical protein
MAGHIITRIRDAIKKQPLTGVSLAVTFAGWLLTTTGIVKPFFEVKVAVQPLTLINISSSNAFILLTSGTAFFVVSAILLYVLLRKGK